MDFAPQGKKNNFRSDDCLYKKDPLLGSFLCYNCLKVEVKCPSLMSSILICADGY